MLGLSCCMLCRLFLHRNFLCSCGEQGLRLSCSAWASHCGGFCLLQSMGSIVVAHRLNCSAEYGIFLNQGLNPCLLHQQADSLPLGHQGNPLLQFWDISAAHIFWFSCYHTNLCGFKKYSQSKSWKLWFIQEKFLGLLAWEIAFQVTPWENCS